MDIDRIHWRYAARSLETAEEVAHTHQVQAGLNRLEALVKDIESEARGYVDG